MKLNLKIILESLLAKLRDIDLPLMIFYLLLIVSGLFIQLDITSASGALPYFLKQFLISLAAIFGCLIIYLFWQNKWFNWSFWIFYAIVLGLLIYVLYYGEDLLGAKRMMIINLKVISISLQPSLLARLVLVVLFARVLSRKANLIADSNFVPFVKNFFPLLIFTGLYYVLILMENHLSAVLTSGFTLISLLFLANIRKTTITVLIIVVLILGSFVVVFHKSAKSKSPSETAVETVVETASITPEAATADTAKKSNFRIARIESFIESCLIIRWLTDNKTNRGMSPNNRESIFCLSTGKLLGCGANEGMGKLKFLHEPRTDFVFAIIVEEFGLLGALFIIFLYMGLVIRGINISSRQSSIFNRLLGFGFSLNIFFNVVIHIGAVSGCLPTTGVTLPFISHGGSSIIVNSMAVGVLLILARQEKVKA